MKIQSIAAALLIAVGAGQAQAQDAEQEACAALLCMSPLAFSAPGECKSGLDAYFDIVVYNKKTFSTVYSPSKTAQKRREALESCSGARSEDIDKVQGTFGILQFSPFSFF